MNERMPDDDREDGGAVVWAVGLMAMAAVLGAWTLLRWAL